MDVAVSALNADPEWDAFVDEVPGGHHLQTSLWGQVKASQGWEALRVLVRQDDELVGGCQLLVRRFRIGAVAYCPRGPLARDRDPSVIARVLDELGTAARRKRALLVKVQPPAGGEEIEELLRARGFVPSALPATNVATVRVDLRRDPDEIRAAMRHSKRQAIRQAEKQGVLARDAGVAGLPTFARLVDDLRERRGKGFSAYTPESYSEILRLFGDGKHGHLILVEYAGDPLAAALNIGWGDTFVGVMSAWSGRHPKLYPNELMHWYGMQWARERGYKYFDFDGIPESVANAKLAGGELPPEGKRGAAAYKLGMGGEVTLSPGAFDRSYQPWLASVTRQIAPRLNLRSSRIVKRFRGRQV